MLCLTGEAAGRSVASIRGVGPVREERLAHLGISTCAELLLHLPHRYEDWRPLEDPREAHRHERCALPARIQGIKTSRWGKPRTELQLDCAGQAAEALVYGRRWLHQRLSRGSRVLVYGSWERTGDVLTCSGAELDFGIEGEMVSIYPATEGLSSRMIRGMVLETIDEVSASQQPVMPPALRSKHNLCSLPQALHAVHCPRDENDARRGRISLAFLEYLLFGLAAGLAEQHRRGRRGTPHVGSQILSDRLLKNLPFDLTGAQASALKSISEDMAEPSPMYRLLQGDVASGKTVVAVWASVRAVECGGRAVWLVPTRLLAEQHAAKLRFHCDGLEIAVSLVTGETGGGIAETDDIIVGTHSLLRRDLPDATLLVVDEQQRFGVEERAKLEMANPRADVLLLSATPIPRTLARTFFGGLDVTTLHEHPPGRTPVATRIVAPEKRETLIRFISSRVHRGEGVYVVCPSVSDMVGAEGNTIPGAVSRARQLREQLPGVRIGLIHGGVGGEERARILKAFEGGDVDAVVGTTVLQVGVDIQRATVMVVENADHFGITELHQLRGRVGRGRRQGVCLLIPSTARDGEIEKLQLLTETNDGFCVSRWDLRSRGMGDFFSTLQHGSPSFVLGEVLRSARLRAAVENASSAILASDPRLQGPEHTGLYRMVSHLYGDSFLASLVL